MMMVGSIFQTTYQDDFISSRVLPPLFEFHAPSFNPDQDKLEQRCIPFAQPIFPHRKRESDIPIAVGFSTLIHRLRNARTLVKNVPKSPEKIKTPEINSRPNSTGDLPQVVVNELVKLGHYSTSSQLHSAYLVQPNYKANKYRPPPKDLRQNNERARFDNSGRVLGRAQDKPENWQSVGCIWDKLQERRATGLSQSARPMSKQHTRLLSRPRLGDNKENKMMDSDSDCINKLSSNIPGYSGYQPRLPNTHQPQNKVQTMSNVTYREHPRITYRLPTFGHKAPMSRTVTLTEPYNPYNKVNKEEIVA